jgi:ubiquinone/menaquinone biosynthesis C-methylase UbiE
VCLSTAAHPSGAAPLEPGPYSSNTGRCLLMVRQAVRGGHAKNRGCFGDRFFSKKSVFSPHAPLRVTISASVRKKYNPLWYDVQDLIPLPLRSCYPISDRGNENMGQRNYLMEGDEEAIRLDLKTDPQVVINQAQWAGLKPGMRVADLGCGSGKTTYHLNELVGSKGAVFGIDIAQQRIDYAENKYHHDRIQYVCKDIREPLEDLGMFDFIWLRFVLEYYRLESFDIVKNISRILKPGGILCLIDLDCNCLRYFGHSARLEKYLNIIMDILQNEFNFDPYAGIKLYSYLYDAGYQDIDVKVSPHNLIFGELKDVDSFNFAKKAEMVGRHSKILFEDYEDGFEGFYKEVLAFFSDHRRFTYTPLISCSGRKPAS